MKKVQKKEKKARSDFKELQAQELECVKVVGCGPLQCIACTCES